MFLPHAKGVIVIATVATLLAVVRPTNTVAESCSGQSARETYMFLSFVVLTTTHANARVPTSIVVQ